MYNSMYSDVKSRWFIKLHTCKCEKIDLNRDAVDRKAIESKLLRNILEDFNPHFALIYTIKEQFLELKELKILLQYHF